MGLFSSKKIINVSSTLYNLAGPEEGRPNFLKSTVFASILRNSTSISDDITTAYFKGIGVNQRQFLNYANSKNLVGLPTTRISNSDPVSASLVTPHISNPNNYVVSVSEAEVNKADPEPFLIRWILENYPNEISTNWVGDYQFGYFAVQFVNGDFYTFTDTDYDPTATYVTANYVFYEQSSEDDYQLVSTNQVTSKQSVSGWNQIENLPATVSVDLSRTTVTEITGSDGRMPIVTYDDASVGSFPLNRTKEVYEQFELDTVDGDALEGTVRRLTYIGSDYVTDDYSVVTVTTQNVGGVTLTTTVTTTGDQANILYEESIKAKPIYENAAVGSEQMFVYKVGTGNSTLDSLATDVANADFSNFYPFIPLRINNDSLREEPYASNGLYRQSEKAYKRLSDRHSFSELLDKIEDNDDIDDIDYAYLVFGLLLNTNDMSARYYIQEFFKSLMAIQKGSASSITDLQTHTQEYQDYVLAYQQWQTDNTNIPWEDRTPPPTRVTVPEPQLTTIQLTASDDTLGDTSFDVRLSWVDVETSIITGKFSYVDPGNGVTTARDAKVGEITIEKGAPVSWVVGVGYQATLRSTSNSVPSMYIRRQITENSYEETIVWGAVHENYIYGGKRVSITSNQALDDDEESGFFVPMHRPTLQEIGLKHATQLATVNTHILFNAYTVTKQKWYQRGFFKFLLLIVMIVVSVTLFPGAFATGGGILGTNAALGATLGLAGTSAIVAGVVANYLASVIVFELLSVVGSELFGEEWSVLFAAIGTLVLGVVGAGTPLFSSENILAMSDAVINGYNGFVMSEMSELQTEMASLSQNYEEAMQEINELIASLGGNDLNFNPMQFTDVTRNEFTSSKGYLPETSDQFIRRTQMTGTDLVEITLGMVYDFVEIQNTLPKN